MAAPLKRGAVLTPVLKPIRSESRPNFGGKPWRYDLLAEHDTKGVLGLCQLDRIREGTATTYYIRIGVLPKDGERAQLCRGGTPFKSYAKAYAHWQTIVSSEVAS